MRNLIFGLIILMITDFIFPQSDFRFNINAINLPINNEGILADINIYDPDPVISGSGGKFAGHVFLFSGGFFLSGYTNGNLWTNGVASASLLQDYLPGRVTGDPSDPVNIIYVVKKSDPDFSQSWQDWRDAVDLGADFYDGNGDGIYYPIDLNSNGIWDIGEDKPDILGDQTAWCVYNDKLPSDQRRYNQVSPQGIEIQQTIFGFTSANNHLNHTLFIRYKLINTGTVAEKLDSVHFASWADADLGDAWNDLVGTDTVAGSSFYYNDGDDSEYGSTPPAFFIQLLQGPRAYIPGVTFIDNNSNGIYDEGTDTALDTAYSMRGDLLGISEYPGARNQPPMASMINKGGDPNYQDPSTHIEANNYMRGLSRTGLVINPCNFYYGEVRGGVNCSEVNPYFIFSGDPVTDYGWIGDSPGDYRSFYTTGPFELRIHEPVEIWVAYIVNNGTNPLNAIDVVRGHAGFSKAFYETNFTDFTVGLDDGQPAHPAGYELMQNYPNPFNPSTVVSYQLPVAGFVSLKVFDILGREVATLVDEYKPAGRYEVKVEAEDWVSGVYLYQLHAGDPSTGSGRSFIQTRKMILLK